MTPTEMYKLCKPVLDGLLGHMAPKADEDFKQDVWVKLMPLAAKMDDSKGDPTHLFYIVARNLIIDLLRKARNRKTQVNMLGIEPDELSLGTVEPMTEGFIMPTAKTPKTQVQYQIVAKMLCQGYDQKEIAPYLGVSPMRVHWITSELRGDGQRAYQWPKKAKTA